MKTTLDIGSAAGGVVGSLLGLVGQNQQVKNQKKLNEHQAKVNYEYGEKAAENAYARTLDMNKITYEQESPLAKVKQLEEAGLSKSLMYGMPGGMGGAGSASSQAQGGGSSGMSAPQAPNPTEAIMLGLQAANLKADIELKEANANKLNADATTTDSMRNTLMENAKQQGKEIWLRNIATEFKNNTDPTVEPTEQQMEVFGNKIYGSTGISNRNFISIREAKELKEITAGTELDEANKSLIDNKAFGYWTELLNATVTADAAAASAAAKQLEAQYNTGGNMNAQWWIDRSIKLVGMITNAI